ncbi:MAG: DUF4198 domain-containing protein [Deltaproteobacteria bacterium]|nr:DUF4198 domain-containing protein [Deltaproteobacteria bacterium]
MKKTYLSLSVLLIVLCLAASPAYAHFGMIIPSDEMVMKDDPKNIKLNLMFWHPFEGQVTPIKIKSHTAWQAAYLVGRPGLYVFYMEPEAYWEPAEDCFIIHYTKTYVTAMGEDEGWDEPIGLKTEIVPLSKPYGLYTGNVFQGVVMLKGKAVPYAEVEVEYFNQDGQVKAPTGYMITQTIKADKNGVFTYAVPRAGWWGFAALNADDKKIKRSGEEKSVEIGAVIWVRFYDMK